MTGDRLGVAVHGGTLATVAAAARRAEERGFESVWTTEFYDRSATVSLAAMALTTSTITVASGIAYAVGRSPLVLAAEARDLDELSGGRLLLGLGTGTRRMQQDWHGADGLSPAPRLEELVPLLRRIWAMDSSGCSTRAASTGWRCDPTAEVTPRPPIPVYLAGFNTRMVQAAGAVADGLVGHPIFTAATSRRSSGRRWPPGRRAPGGPGRADRRLRDLQRGRRRRTGPPRRGRADRVLRRGPDLRAAGRAGGFHHRGGRDPGGLGAAGPSGDDRRGEPGHAGADGRGRHARRGPRPASGVPRALRPALLLRAQFRPVRGGDRRPGDAAVDTFGR